jgi:hypothetical protein
MPRRSSGAQALVLLTARFQRASWYGESITQINDSQMLCITCDVGRFELK